VQTHTACALGLLEDNWSALTSKSILCIYNHSETREAAIECLYSIFSALDQTAKCHAFNVLPNEFFKDLELKKCLKDLTSDPFSNRYFIVRNDDDGNLSVANANFALAAAHLIKLLDQEKAMWDKVLTDEKTVQSNHAVSSLAIAEAYFRTCCPNVTQKHLEYALTLCSRIRLDDAHRSTYLTELWTLKVFLHSHAM